MQWWRKHKRKIAWSWLAGKVCVCVLWKIQLIAAFLCDFVQRKIFWSVYFKKLIKCDLECLVGEVFLCFWNKKICQSGLGSAIINGQKNCWKEIKRRRRIKKLRRRGRTHRIVLLNQAPKSSQAFKAVFELEWLKFKIERNCKIKKKKKKSKYCAKFLKSVVSFVNTETQQPQPTTA